MHQIIVRPITPNPAGLWYIFVKPLKRDRIRPSARRLVAQITRPTTTRTRRGRPSPTQLKYRLTTMIQLTAPRVTICAINRPISAASRSLSGIQRKPRRLTANGSDRTTINSQATTDVLMIRLATF